MDNFWLVKVRWRKIYIVCFKDTLVREAKENPVRGGERPDGACFNNKKCSQRKRK